MDETEQWVEMQLEASQWACTEADKLIAQWGECKTAHARKKLIPKLEEIRKRLAFEAKGIGKLIEGEEWKNQ